MTDNPTAAGPMPPGTYLRKRREAAELTLDDVTATIAARFRVTAATVRARIVAIEDHDLSDLGPLDHFTVIDALQRVLRFDRNVYFALVGAIGNPATPLPPICRVCACTEFVPCLDGGGEPCGWAKVPADEAPLCTMCIPDPAEGGLLLPPANDREVRDAA
jgi:hypothetical protein